MVLPPVTAHMRSNQVNDKFKPLKWLAAPYTSFLKYCETEFYETFTLEAEISTHLNVLRPYMLFE